MSSAKIFKYDAEDVIELLTPMIRNSRSMILREIGNKAPLKKLRNPTLSVMMVLKLTEGLGLI
jgi:hypothetical protein